jgi:AraC-like DNA-binding protein
MHGILALDSPLSIRLSGMAGMSAKQDQQYRQIVDRVAGLSQQLSSESVRIQDLCATARISQRMLRRAFHHVYGIAPYRYIRRLRMHEAMKALSSPTSPAATVTQVATDFGFLELGRFSVEYRSMFGECPSATLRRALASRRSDDATLSIRGVVRISGRSNARVASA